MALIEALRRHGYPLSPGTLCPILHGFEQNGWLVREERAVDGKVHKYHAITDVGRRGLTGAWLRIAELVDEVLGPEAGEP
jgi:PadR family transcriptional regulator PadR